MGIRGELVETDVLVIGGGIAACFAAIRAKELGTEVIMVDMGQSGFSGESAHGMGNFRVVLPTDDHDSAVKQTVLVSEYMVNQDFVEAGVSETWDRFQDLVKFGVNFQRDEKGEVIWYMENTHYPDLKQRLAAFDPFYGSEYSWKIRQEVTRRGIKICDRVAITELLTHNGEVRGAIGFHTRRGEFYVFKAKAIVIATGTYVPTGRFYANLAGMGIAMALRAGAHVRQTEFGKLQLSATAPNTPHIFFYSLPEDWDQRVVNAKGEEFFEQYEELRRVPGRKYLGPPWRYRIQAVFKEVKEGRGPCYVDYRVPGLMGKLRDSFGGGIKRTLREMQAAGLTPDKLQLELGVKSGSHAGGGIMIDLNGKSSLLGLYAAGTASDMCGTAQYTICSHLSGSAITGHRAGESAAKYALAQLQPVVDEEQMGRLKEETFAPLSCRGGVTPDKLRMKFIQAYTSYHDIRNETSLRKGREEFRKLREESKELMAGSPHELAQCHRVKNLVQCAEAGVATALVRRESRLEHFREDYPLTDNKDWLKWVIVQRVGEELQASLEDIPIEHWKYKPEAVIFDRLRKKGEGYDNEY